MDLKEAIHVLRNGSDLEVLNFLKGFTEKVMVLDYSLD